MAINVSTLESNLTTKINATSGTTEAKEFLLLGKAVESINTAVSSSSLAVSNNLSDVANAATALSNLGGAGLASPAFTGTPTAPTATAGTNNTQLATTAFVAGEVAGIVDSAPATLDTLNELAAALGDDANFSTTVTNSIATKLPLAGGTMTGNVTYNDNIQARFGSGADATVNHDGSNFSIVNNTGNFLYYAAGTTDHIFHTNGTQRLKITGAGNIETVNGAGVTVDGTLRINEVIESVGTSSTTSGTIFFNVLNGSVKTFTANQTANRTINITGDGSNTLNSVMANDESVTVTALMTQGSTAYYLNAYQIDGTAVTPKWSGGSAPTAGNPSGIDVYTFTIIKTANATFTVLASQTQYA